MDVFIISKVVLGVVFCSTAKYVCVEKSLRTVVREGKKMEGVAIRNVLSYTSAFKT